MAWAVLGPEGLAGFSSFTGCHCAVHISGSSVTPYQLVSGSNGSGEVVCSGTDLLALLVFLQLLPHIRRPQSFGVQYRDPVQAGLRSSVLEGRGWGQGP